MPFLKNCFMASHTRRIVARGNAGAPNPNTSSLRLAAGSRDLKLQSRLLQHWQLEAPGACNLNRDPASKRQRR